MRIDQIKIDEWYDIPGYGGKYQINYYGNIRRALKNGRYKEIHPFIKKSNGRRYCTYTESIIAGIKQILR